MSDDRFKQARRSLINQQSRAPQAQSFEDYGEDSEGSTQMVDLQALQAGAAAQPGGYGGAPNYGEDSEGSTQMVDLQALQAGAAAQPAPASRPGMGSGQVIMGGGAPADLEGSTQFVNLNELQAGPPAANYGGSSGESTQFVDLNALAAGAKVSQPGMYSSVPIEQDPVLRQGYQFGAEGIQRFGEITLVFARNALGRDVVLKRVWEGPPEQMPAWLRDRIMQIAQIQHPSLTRMNGLFAGGSGCWVELERPPGMRLTHMLQQSAQPMNKVAQWIPQVADAIKTIHGFGILYGSLTPDAIWIDERTGQVALEPYDALAFELRGNLGQFGGPEMSTPPEQRPVTPASDVYSMAMIITASLTGNPPDMNKLAALQNQKLLTAIKAALYPDPQRRPVTFDELLGGLGGGGGGGAKAGPDPKILAVGAVALVLVVVLAVMMMGGGGGGEAPAEAAPAEAAAEPTPDDKKPAEPSSPNEVVKDARLTIVTDFDKNPAEATKPTLTAPKKEPSDKELAEASQERQKALKLIDEAKTLQEQYREDNYKQAFIALSRAVALQGELTQEDRNVWATLVSTPAVYKYHLSYLASVETRMTEPNGSVTRAQLPYRQLKGIYPLTPAAKFFEANGKANVKILTPQKKKSKAKADEEEEGEEGTEGEESAE
jgi:serine/threonine protein kinase